MTLRTLSPNLDEAVGKILDGEAIVINLVTGAYFSMLGAGAIVWQAVEHGLTVDDASAAIARAYAIDEAVVRRDVERLVTELASHNLIRIGERTVAATAGSGTGSIDAFAADAAARAPYEAPVLNVYTDMLEMLALDPPMPVIGELPTEWPKEPAR